MLQLPTMRGIKCLSYSLACALALPLFGVGIGPAEAEETCRVAPIASIEMFYDRTGRPMVPASLNGLQKYMILDTGGAKSALDMASVRQFGLRIGQKPFSIVGVGGEPSSAYVTIQDFRVGNLPSVRRELMIPAGDSGGASELEPVGVLGADFFMDYSTEFDFTAGMLRLFDQAPCEPRIADWKTQAVAVVPFRLDASDHIRFPVTLDGAELTAMLDTGASTTVLNIDIARRVFDLDLDSPEVDRIGTLDGRYRANVYRRRFESLTVDQLTFDNPLVVLLPDMMASDTSPHFAEPDESALPELILGMSILSQLHLTIDYRERNLYIAFAVPSES